MKDIPFFESGLQLIHGQGGWRNALAELIQLVAESANSTSASFYVADWRQNVLKPAITYGLPPTYVDACGDVSIGDQCCGRAVLHRKPWVVSDMLSDPLFSSARDAALASPIRAGFSVPVIDGNNECIGSIGCHYVEPHTPSSADIERNEVWASVIAHTISQYMGSLASESGK